MSRIARLLLSLSLSALTGLCVTSCREQAKTYYVGFSQCHDDDWFGQMRDEAIREANQHDNVQVEFRVSDNDTEQQVHDIEAFIARRVDLIVLSPNEVCDRLDSVVTCAYDAGIPVLVVDRRLHTDRYTAHIGSDNEEMGRQIGHYVVDHMGGRSRILCIMGESGASVSVDRHEGFTDAIFSHPGMVIVDTIRADWNRKDAYRRFGAILSERSDFDLVVAQNDEMAIGAWMALQHHEPKPDHAIRFVGIDGLHGPGLGIEHVEAGHLEATVANLTAGDLIIRVALDILEGRSFERDIALPTVVVDGSNARLTQMQYARIDDLSQRLDGMNDALAHATDRVDSQRRWLGGVAFVTAVIVVLLVFLTRSNKRLALLNSMLQAQKYTLGRQRDQLARQHDQLASLSAQASEANKAKLAFLTNIGHDFRTPLTLIADPIRQVMAEGDNLSDRQLRLLEIVQKNTSAMLRLVNQMLDVRKLDSGQMPLVLTRFDLGRSLQDWADAFAQMAESRAVHYVVQIEPSASGYAIVADAEKVERVVYNLISNAFRFTPRGGTIHLTLCAQPSYGGARPTAEASAESFAVAAPAAAASVWLSDAGQEGGSAAQPGVIVRPEAVSSRGEANPAHPEVVPNRGETGAASPEAATCTYCIEVSDTGPGMTPEQVAHAFEQFYQVNDSGRGTGLGLTLSRALVELHHGHITLDSHEGQGTTVRVVLPAAQEGSGDVPVGSSSLSSEYLELDCMLDASEAEAAGAESPVDLLNEAGQPTLLVVDDNADVCAYIRILLGGDFRIMTASSGEEGLRMALRDIPDIVICDVMMPGIGGLECCRRIKAEPATCHIPVLMLTAYSLDEHKIEAFACGADAYVAKPFTAQMLRTRVQNLIDNRAKVRVAQEEAIDVAHSSIGEADKTFAARVQQCINGHLGEADFDVESLSNELGFSRVQLYRKVKALTGYAPNELLRIARLKRARQLFSQTDRSVSEIAFDVGFSSSSYFTKCFREYYGETPTDYGKRIRR